MPTYPQKGIIQGGQKWHKDKTIPKSQNMGGRKFRKVRNFALMFLSCSSSASDFKSVKLVLTRIRRAWIDSTNLALIAFKNYKINHKMRSVE